MRIGLLQYLQAMGQQFKTDNDHFLPNLSFAIILLFDAVSMQFTLAS
jgi:hypothetical protein